MIDVDCTYEPQTPTLLESKLARLLKGKLVEVDTLDKAVAKTTFCNVIDL